MNTVMLTELATKLYYKTKAENFDMGDFDYCVIGHSPNHRDHVFMGFSGFGKLYDLTGYEVRFICSSAWCGLDNTPQGAAARIMYVVSGRDKLQLDVDLYRSIITDCILLDYVPPAPEPCWISRKFTSFLVAIGINPH